MKIEKLKSALDPWIRVNTWHTSHPLDDERFHLAIKSALDSLGTLITFEEFGEAMEQLVKQYHPGFQTSYRDELIEEFSQRAENIASYLYDNEI